MAHSRSQKKRIKTDNYKTLRNKSYKSALKTIKKNALLAMKNNKPKEEILLLVKEVCRKFDKMASKKIIHKNKAANQKSQIMNKVNKYS